MIRSDGLDVPVTLRSASGVTLPVFQLQPRDVSLDYCEGFSDVLRQRRNIPRQEGPLNHNQGLLQHLEVDPLCGHLEQMVPVSKQIRRHLMEAGLVMHAHSLA